MNLTNTQVPLHIGLQEYCVLHIISRGEVPTADLIDELTGAKLLAAEGTLYPLLNRLKSAALVTARYEESETGPARKYYSITQEGLVNVKRLSESWKALVQSINQITKKK